MMVRLPNSASALLVTTLLGHSPYSYGARSVLLGLTGTCRGGGVSIKFRQHPCQEPINRNGETH
jgi:hypothetical protein